MIFEVVGTSLLVEDIQASEIWTVGPFEVDDEAVANAKQLVETLRPEGETFGQGEIPDNFPDYKEALFLVISPDGEPSLVVWDIDHRE